MKNWLLPLTCLLTSFQTLPTTAQALVDTVASSNILGQVYYSGLLWNTPTGALPGLEYPRIRDPASPRKATVFASNLWLSATDSSGRLYVAAETDRAGSSPNRGFWAGPMAASFAVANDDPAYQHVWQVTRAEINAHRTNYTQPGYQVPASLLTWPARTASYTGPSALAPFVDVNANGHYDPQAGDYPDVLGDIAAFFIANDAAGLKRPYTLPMGVEVQGLVFAYDSACCQLPTTIFVRYRVANHSGRHYQQFYLGHYADFDIGYYGDDYVGSDSTLNMMYAYNGDGVDEGPYGYGFNPPTQAVVALRPAMNGFTGYGNSIGGALSNPAQAIHFARLLRGELLTGVPITTGGDGSTGTGTLTRYMFSGNSCNGTGWTESAAGNLPGDRRALMSFGPYSFAPGQVRTVDLAYVTNVSCAQIPNVVSQWQSFFPGVLAAPAMQPVSTLTLYPNPASQQVRLLLSENPSQPLMVTVTDMLGRVVQKQSISTTEALVDLRGLPAGLYTVRCGAVARRLVVE